jgi:hypothetical protein
MGNIMTGIAPTRVDTTAEFRLGLRVEDPRADRPDNQLRYIKAGSAISAGNSVKVDLTDETNEPFALVPTSAVTDVVVGIAEMAIASGSFGWVTVGGKAPSAKAAVSQSAGAKLGASASAGTLQAVSSNSADQVAYAAGIGAVAIDSTDSNTSTIDVYIA